ncbi:hypothetical protein TraAM80_07705 [Trypanosoma rangeli]|uniref:Uncharacterized protein n=1 Tax=Trypanosoma rangeli TaxID=5698 RepID=A0A3R7KS36_TRYRA|nr:uncharacterized protein TraAM80_07705 [Trypanosoma rangeli]RNF00245.1 hypothetical protein TraAM80_07705 [Trypanosoma rangeli]|eukprot:RNF00245.1 hypothetical protein TraAM80_07705 [Trypanosoma rangeli]
MEGNRVPHRYNFFAAESSEPIDASAPLGKLPERLAPVALRETIYVQLETLQAIDRTERLMNTATNLGEESKQQLSQDKVIIETIDNILESNESVLQRVIRDVHWFRVQLQKDKLFVCLSVIVVILSVAAIVVAVVYKQRG